LIEVFLFFEKDLVKRNGFPLTYRSHNRKRKEKSVGQDQVGSAVGIYGARKRADNQWFDFGDKRRGCANPRSYPDHPDESDRRKGGWALGSERSPEIS
jgi:hypothetical protein